MTIPADEPLQERFVALLDAHRRLLFRVAAVWCRSPEDRRDLIQETAAQLWRAFPRYDERLRFSTWMYRIALNVAISFRRRETVRARHASLDEVAILEIPADASAASPGNEDLKLLERFLGGLAELDRALMLLYLDGNRHDAIAEVLGITETNVGTRIGRLKERLRRELAENG